MSLIYKSLAMKHSACICIACPHTALRSKWFTFDSVFCSIQVHQQLNSYILYIANVLNVMNLNKKNSCVTCMRASSHCSSTSVKSILTRLALIDHTISNHIRLA